MFGKFLGAGDAANQGGGEIAQRGRSVISTIALLNLWYIWYNIYEKFIHEARLAGYVIINLLTLQLQFDLHVL